MNQRAIIVAVVLFVVIVGGMFAFAYMKSTELKTTLSVPDAPKKEEGQIMRIEAKHFFSDGTHTVAGEMILPTPCDLLEAEAIDRESFSEQVIIAFTVINNSDGLSCPQVETPQRFKVRFDASEGAVIEAIFKGNPAILNLIKAGPGENPDDFELFIKG